MAELRQGPQMHGHRHQQRHSILVLEQKNMQVAIAGVCANHLLNQTQNMLKTGGMSREHTLLDSHMQELKYLFLLLVSHVWCLHVCK